MMIDKEKILSKIDELNRDLEMLESIKPTEFKEYENNIEKKAACERFLHVSIECVNDICNIILSNLKLGLPSDEDEVFKKLQDVKVIKKDTAIILRGMKSFRNILVHKYGTIDDELVFENLSQLEDFEKFKTEVLDFIKLYKPKNRK